MDKKNTSTVKSIIILELILASFLHLIGSYVSASFDLSEWSVVTRAIIAIIFLLASVYILLLSYNDEN